MTLQPSVICSATYLLGSVVLCQMQCVTSDAVHSPPDAKRIGADSARRRPAGAAPARQLPAFGGTKHPASLSPRPPRACLPRGAGAEAPRGTHAATMRAGLLLAALALFALGGARAHVHSAPRLAAVAGAAPDATNASKATGVFFVDIDAPQAAWNLTLKGISAADLLAPSLHQATGAPSALPLLEFRVSMPAGRASFGVVSRCQKAK